MVRLDSDNPRTEPNRTESLQRKKLTTSRLSRVDKFLKENCKSGNITPNDAIELFDYMIRMEPTPPMSSFNIFSMALLRTCCSCFTTQKWWVSFHDTAREGFVSTLERGKRPKVTT